MAALHQDVRFVLRTLRRSPGFTFAVVLILALGIGANTAIFSVINAVLLKPLSYDEPDRIVRLREQKLQQGLGGISSSHPTLIYWRDNNQVFEDIAGMQRRRFYVTSPERAFHVMAQAVSPCYFSVMGVRPMLGREFLPEEEEPGHEPVVILSYAFWREHMRGDPQAIGKSLVLDDQAYTVVGVMPATFRDSLQHCAPFWVPLVLNPESKGRGTGVRARLKPGVTLAQAEAQMNVLERRLAEADPEHHAGYTVVLHRFLDDEMGSNRSMLYLLWAGVGLVLLIACTNASGLFLIHSNARRQEIAVRAALGASRGQIIRHMLTEGLVLSVTAGGLGVLLAHWAIRLLVRISPADIPRMHETRIDMPVLCFALGASVITGLALSLLPAWKATSIHLSHALKQGLGGLSQGRPQRRLQGGLVVAQIGIASTLLMAVAMLTQSLIAMQRVDLGFQPANVLVAEIELPKVRYPESDQSFNFYQQLLHRVQASPGVHSAALVSGGLDLGTGGGFIGFSIDGRPPIEPGHEPMARVMTVSRDFFKAMGMPVLQGRDFTHEDTLGGIKGMVIDENLARKYFPDEDPTGQRIDGLPVVGVASTLRDYEVLAPTTYTMYQPMFNYCYLISDIVVRTHGDPTHLAGELRGQVAALDKDLQITRIYALESSLADMLAPRCYTTILLGLFAQVALILAAVGLFALLQYAVTQRTHEIGVRMALGATQTRITQTFLRRATTLILLGLLAGMLGGYIASRLMTSLLYQAGPADPIVLIVALLILVAVALLASYIPARRAAKIDPMQALRCE